MIENIKFDRKRGWIKNLDLKDAKQKMKNVFKAFEDYKNELYGKGKRKPLSHKEKQKRKAKRKAKKRNNKRR